MSVCYKMKEKESYIEKQKGIFGDTTWFTYRYEVNGMVYETSAGSLDICRKARDKWMKMMSVAFTGHRTIRTNKYALSVSLNEEVRFCYENGSRFFYIGCAVGFDMMAAHTILEQRKQYPDMVLVAVVPYVGQDVYFNKEDKQRYADILRQADKVVVLSEYYYAQCYAHRNDYMISHACRLIAYWDGKSVGGTSYTFNKAQKKKLVIHNLF